jgi:hypothetical protein
MFLTFVNTVCKMDHFTVVKNLITAQKGPSLQNFDLEFYTEETSYKARDVVQNKSNILLKIFL